MNYIQVQNYTERHSDDFVGHTGKKGREITLDQHVISILEGKYPLPNPIEIVNCIWLYFLFLYKHNHISSQRYVGKKAIN